MKNIFRFILLSILFVSISRIVFSQADISGGSGHVWAANYYCGWNAASNQPFDLRNDAAQRIRLFTNGSSTTTNLRMLIEPNKTITYQGVNLNIGGFIGMGTTNWWNANRT